VSLATLLAVRAHQEGRAQRTARVCHRVLRPDPLLICLFGLGAEPFAAAAVGWARNEQELRTAAAGDPRERRLLFPALEQMAADLLPYFEAPFASVRRVPGPRGGRERLEVDELPQIVVPNVETLLLLGRIGRRTRYLPTDGPTPASEALVRLGAHLDFLRKHAAHPGQQLIIVASELVADHWQTSLNEWESRALPALDAFVEPPPGIHGHEAAAEADREPLGPRPNARQDAAVAPLIRHLNEARAKSVDRSVVAPLLVPLERHYRPLLERAAEITWRCVRREAAYPTSRHASMREQADRDAYARHMDLVTQGVRRRTRMTPAQAIRFVSDLERDAARLVAQEAVDDPLRMVDVLLADQAVQGTVSRVDDTHRPAGTQGRPLVELSLATPTLLEPGDRVHWDQRPDKDWQVTTVAPTSIELMLLNPRARPLPEVGDTVCFTSLTVKDEYFAASPSADLPWTHVPKEAPADAGPIEDVQAA
jgi:hypothetical protein